MYEHGLIPSDYTERPVYQTERSLELQHQLVMSCDMIDDMLRLPQTDGNTLRHKPVRGGGVAVFREMSYYHPEHQEVMALGIEYESRPRHMSETYSLAVDACPQATYTTESALTTQYILHKSADMIVSAHIRSIDLENGGYYDERAMTVYDARQLFNELVEFSVVARESLSAE